MTKKQDQTKYMWSAKEKEETTEVEHSSLDMRDILLRMKIDQIRKGEPLQNLDISIDSLMVDFCKLLGSDIENSKKVRQIIDYRFISTKILNISNMFALLMLMMIPFQI